MNPTVKAYEPPLSKEGEPLIPGQEPVIYPGVRGYAMEHQGEIWIPEIIAENPGSGQVSKMLEELSSRCRIVNVISPQLSNMLRKRGWIPEQIWSKGPFGAEQVDVWKRGA